MSSFHNGIDKNLKSRLLAAPLVIRFYVSGDVRDDPEIYLTELINHSEYFLHLSGGEQYIHVKDQSDGQCDAVSAQYELDYKLTESTSRLQADRLHSSQIITNGAVTIFCAARDNREILATYLHSGLRRLATFEEIESVIQSNVQFINIQDRSVDNIEEQVKSDISDYLKTLGVKKNLLYFIPEVFFFEDNIFDEETAIEKIREALNVDFHLAFSYRAEKNPGFDTYLSCIFEDRMLFFRFISNQLVYIDAVELSQSETYGYIRSRYVDCF